MTAPARDRSGSILDTTARSFTGNGSREFRDLRPHPAATQAVFRVKASRAGTLTIRAVGDDGVVGMVLGSTALLAGVENEVVITALPVPVLRATYTNTDATAGTIASAYGGFTGQGAAGSAR